MRDVRTALDILFAINVKVQQVVVKTGEKER